MAKFRMGVVGAGRGASVAHLYHLHPDCDVVALADPVPERCERVGQSLLPSLEATYPDLDSMLEHDLDVVFVANYPWEHVPLVIRCLEAGRHVHSEVVACRTLAEGVALARAVESADTMYSFVQNTSYYRPVLEMKRLYAAGTLGEYMYGECEYVHERQIVAHNVSYLDHDRGARVRGGLYITHSLSPIVQITGTRPVRCTGFTTRNRLNRLTGDDADDLAVVMCEMDNGALTKAMVGHGIHRQPIMHYYSIYGTNGQAENQRSPHEEWLHLYLEGQDRAENRTSYVPKWPYEIDWIRNASGYHGGADVYMVDAFMQALRDGGPPPCDVYTALDVTLPGILGLRSAFQGSVPIEVPDLRDEQIRTQYENDHWVPPRGSVHEDVEIPKEVFEERRQKTLKHFGTTE